MITLRRAEDRQHGRQRRREVWTTFPPPDAAAPLAHGFGALEVIDEYRLPPGARSPRHRLRDAEILTYVREGTLAYEDSLGRSGVIQAGEFHRLCAARALRHGEMNASSTEWAHVFQLWLHPSEPRFEGGREQRRFSNAERASELCVIASPDARRGSLSLGPGVLVYSAMLGSGKHVVHELGTDRSAWLHVIEGEVRLADRVLTTGDGAGIRDERAVSFTAGSATEIILVDLAAHTLQCPVCRRLSMETLRRCRFCAPELRGAGRAGDRPHVPAGPPAVAAVDLIASSSSPMRSTATPMP